MSPDSADEARRFFPRGLAQPVQGFRFSADSLLLASFVRPGTFGAAVDLGAGCGVAGLGLLLRGGAGQVLGLDVDPDMTAAAQANADRLGFSHRLRSLTLDLRSVRDTGALAPESFDLALANPPFRTPGSGRRCPDQARDRARFETAGTLDDFARAAAFLLKNRASLHLVHLAERLADVFEALRRVRLEPKRLRLVQPREGAAASQALVEARKNSRPGLSVEPPLTLYGPDAQVPALTPDALAFCPFLACNAGPGEP